MELNQYQLILVQLDPTVGSEIRKTRPCVIISPNEMNHHLRTITIAPLSTSSKKYPTRIQVQHNNQIGYVVLDQIRTVDKARVIRKFGFLSSIEIKSCKQVLREIFVD
ncbi:MAG: type II toxin-antitoxin system PemK/MazF family toxin [Flavobacteriales bacterium]